MGKGSGTHIKYTFQKQAFIEHTEAPPIQNQWYTALNTQFDVRLVSVTLEQNNDELANKSLQCRITLGTDLETGTVDAASGTVYFGNYRKFAGVIVYVVGERELYLHTDVRGTSCLVEFRITSPLGTNQDISCYIRYDAKVVSAHP